MHSRSESYRVELAQTLQEGRKDLLYVLQRTAHLMIMRRDSGARNMYRSERGFKK